MFEPWFKQINFKLPYLLFIYLHWKLWIYLFGKYLLSTYSMPGTRIHSEQNKKLPRHHSICDLVSYFRRASLVA